MRVSAFEASGTRRAKLAAATSSEVQRTAGPVLFARAIGPIRRTGEPTHIAIALLVLKLGGRGAGGDGVCGHEYDVGVFSALPDDHITFLKLFWKAVSRKF